MKDRDIPLANSKVQYYTLLEEESYAVVKTTIRAGGETQWHHHTNVDDRFIVINGILTVEFKDEFGLQRVKTTDYHNLRSGVSHHVKNETDKDLVYVMVQSGGKRDIVLENSVEDDSSEKAPI